MRFKYLNKLHIHYSLATNSFIQEKWLVDLAVSILQILEKRSEKGMILQLSQFYKLLTMCCLSAREHIKKSQKNFEKFG
jgi:hypothetical protein